MGADKLVDILHRRSNAITWILIGAFLEWILILLLLLNSLFSYFILRFADFFGLVRPCLWCSRVDHVFESRKSENLYGELVCEAHARAISKLGYCQGHRKLAESGSMCCDCASPGNYDGRSGSIEGALNLNGNIDLNCSCCGASLQKPGGVNRDHRSEDSVVHDAIKVNGIEARAAIVRVAEAKQEHLMNNEDDVCVSGTATAAALPNSSDIDDESVENQVQHLEFYIENDHLCLIPHEQSAGTVEEKTDYCTSSVQENEIMHAPEANNDRAEEEGHLPNELTTDEIKELVILEGSERTADPESVGSLKLELEAERKVLNALYAELEEERNASEEAASHTMTMINKLQEEKAAMQMEAVQYQRMMEEQSEFDQEALQLLNGLMVTKDRERQELLRELDACRKKVADYEIMARDDGARSEQFTEPNGGDRTRKSEKIGGVNLNESPANLEIERQSILQGLKTLEGKLFMLSDGGGPGDGAIGGFGNDDMEIIRDESGNIGDGRIAFNENGRGLLPPPSLSVDAAAEDARRSVDAEMYELYDRVHALEADIEFLRHCIVSLKKGSKGLNLLEEILAHLRDLKRVESRISGDDVIL